MLNTLVSIKSYIGSLMIFLAFIVSFITLIATYNQPNIKYFLFPLLVSLGIALLNSVVYMNEIIKMKEGVYANDVAVKLSSCPEYWVKGVMYDHNKDPIDVCKNYFKDDKGKMRYVGGSTRSEGKFHTNFKKEGESNLQETLSNMNAVASTNTNENFVDYSITNDNIIRNDSDSESSKLVAYVDSNHDQLSNVHQYENSNIQDIPGSHYHFISSMTQHSNNDNAHIGMSNLWHWHDDTLSTIPSDLMLTNECASNWICESANDNGIIVNLNNLNNRDDLCQHAEKFYWVEAANKCKIK